MLLCFVFGALLVILSLLLVIMGGQHDGLFLSGSPPVLYIYIHMYNFLMANKLCCCYWCVPIESLTWAFQRTHHWTLKFKMATSAILKIVKSPLSQSKMIRFWWNLVQNSRFGTRWQSHGQIWFFQIRDGGQTPYWKSFFGHNSAADCPISVKFCTGKQNSMAIKVT